MTTVHIAGSLLFSEIGYRCGLSFPFVVSGLLLLADAVYSFWVFKAEDYG